MSHLIDGDCYDCRCDGLGYTCDVYENGHPGCPNCYKLSGWYEDYLDDMGEPDDFDAYWFWALTKSRELRNDPDS